MAQPIDMGRCAMSGRRGRSLVDCYACICVKEFPAQALLRLRPEWRASACVVMEGDPPLQQVCSLNRQARSFGLVPGMTKAEVETFPQAKVLARSVNEEAATKAALLECAGKFSPRVEECSEAGLFLCVLDIAGTEKLFGPAPVLAHKLLEQLNSLGMTACMAISRNFHAAILAAKALTVPDPVQVIPPGEEKEALARLPLQVLDLTEEQAETFSLWGIRTLGALAALPEQELIARMGQSGKSLLQLACGERPHLFQPFEPDFALMERMELDSPLENLDALLFIVNLLLDQLIVRSTARALALASVSVALKLQGGAMHTRTVRPALPTSDRQLWLKLMHLDLEAHPPQDAIIAVVLDAEPGTTAQVQLGLFSPQLPEPSRLEVTLARIRALVGEQNVGRAVLEDTHRPEGFHLEPFEVATAQAKAVAPVSTRPGVRRIRPAEMVDVTFQNERPKTFFFRKKSYLVERAYGPWLSSGDWWNPMLWECEQWDLVARAQDGATLCCCVLRDVLRHQWQMVGLYD